MMGVVKALLFDLDGVLVDTARFHFVAWQQLANDLGIPFNEEQNEQLKGVSRTESLERILAWGNKTASAAEKQAWMDKKNTHYLQLVDEMGPEDVLPGVLAFLTDARDAGLRIALGSASKNAQRILDRTGLTPCFDAIVDGTHTSKSKPDPEVFLLGAEALETAPGQCVVVEDSQAGIEAANRARMHSLGIGDPAVLQGANYVVPGFATFSFADFEKLIG